MANIIKERVLPSYAELLEELRRAAAGRLVLEKRQVLRYRRGDGELRYDYVRLRSDSIQPEDPILFIRAGIHGDEVAGPLTLYRRLTEIAECAAERRVKLIIYPLDNPSGFENRSRYNVENDRGSHDAGNNDFMRYELSDGRMAATVPPGASIKAWYWASDAKASEKIPGLRLPQETVALHGDLRDLTMRQIKGCLDLHQDNMIPEKGAYFYCNSGPQYPQPYLPIVQQVARLAPLLAHRSIGSGQEFPSPTDEYGAIRGLHDGTLPDLLQHLGVPFCVTPETTRSVDLRTAEEVNMCWLRGMIDLVSTTASSERSR